MIGSGIDTQLAAKQAADTRDIVRFKQEMDGLKNRMSGSDGDKEKQLRSACQNFEAVFISKLWKDMKSTVPKEGYLHSKQEDMYMSMFDREFAENMAKAGGIGLADMIYEQLSEKLKNTSRNTLSGGVQLKPLTPEPIPLAGKQGAIDLTAEKKAMTLEDWGGDNAEAGENEESVITSETIVSRLAYEKAPQDDSRRLASDAEVKAQLDDLARKLEAERIKSQLLGNTAGKGGAYGKEPDKVGLNLAEIG